VHIPNLDLVQASLVVLIDVDIDWEMGIDVSHLVQETLGDTDDQVVDQGSDCAESGDILAGTVVELNVDDIGLWVGEVDREMAQVLDELACVLLDLTLALQYLGISYLGDPRL
jgi:hypothetical protein